MDNTSGNVRTFRAHSLCITYINYVQEDTDTYICVEVGGQRQQLAILQKSVVLYFRDVPIPPFHLKGEVYTFRFRHC